MEKSLVYCNRSIPISCLYEMCSSVSPWEREHPDFRRFASKESTELTVTESPLSVLDTGQGLIYLSTNIQMHMWALRLPVPPSMDGFWHSSFVVLLIATVGTQLPSAPWIFPVFRTKSNLRYLVRKTGFIGISGSIILWTWQKTQLKKWFGEGPVMSSSL